DKYRAWFEDARDVYWHFQACRNPGGERVLQGAGPFSFRCGRALVIVLDERGQRDFARPVDPVLGSEQWAWLEGVLADLEGVDALVLANGIPVVDLNQDSATSLLF